MKDIKAILESIILTALMMIFWTVKADWHYIGLLAFFRVGKLSRFYWDNH